jgi:Dipeptidyl aminopeptidases/acylaminoacyl-peptidases
MLSLLAVFGAGYMIIVGTLWVLQRQLLFLPDRSTPQLATAGLPEMTDVRVRTADGLELLAWWHPPDADRPTVVYLHGNGGHIGYRGSRVRPFLDRGMGVLLVSYRGYGGNPGSPSEAGLLADGRAALEFLAAWGIAADRTVLYGESLGTTVAVRLAAEWAEIGRAHV